MVLCIIQARMGSQRLPGKVMRDVMGKPMIGHQLERLTRSQKIDRLIVASSVNKENDSLCGYLLQQGIEVFRGSENDVLDRYYQAALKLKPQSVVRLTADCPLIDYKIVDKVIDHYLKNAFDYVSNIRPRTYPHGLDTEVFSFDALRQAWQEAKSETEREHVTPYLYNSGKFQLGNVSQSIDHSNERWTLDYEEDFLFIEQIYKILYKPDQYFDMQDVLDCKGKYPEIFKINEKRKIIQSK